jgi:DNA end-binding protein Ku
MPRSMWTGSISFGLVNVPVRLFGAVSQKEVRFHMLHGADGGRIQQKRVCSVDGREVAWEEIVKGYEISRNRYVTVTPEELKALEPRATKSIDIEDFVALEEIDPIFFENTYYLAPDRGAAKAYALLYEAMKQTGKVGIARVVLRTKKYLCTVRPLEKALALSTMLYADEVVSQDELGLPSPGEIETRERELAMAKQLVESLTTKFEPEKYRDDFRERVLDLLEKKAEGQEIVAPVEEAAPAQVVNLIDALEASLAAARKAPATAVAEPPEAPPAAAAPPRPGRARGEAPARGEVRRRAEAARTARAPSKRKKTDE